MIVNIFRVAFQTSTMNSILIILAVLFHLWEFSSEDFGVMIDSKTDKTAKYK